MKNKNILAQEKNSAIDSAGVPPQALSGIPKEQEPDWGLLDLLDPIQLGMLYEMLLINAGECGPSENQKPYEEAARCVREAIDSNCGFEDWMIRSQEYCKKLADYDNRG